MKYTLKISKSRINKVLSGLKDFNREEFLNLTKEWLEYITPIEYQKIIKVWCMTHIQKMIYEATEKKKI